MSSSIEIGQSTRHLEGETACDSFTMAYIARAGRLLGCTFTLLIEVKSDVQSEHVQTL